LARPDHNEAAASRNGAELALDLMRQAVIALSLIAAGPAMAQQVLHFPNEFEYWRLWAECGEPYLYCDHSTRTCMSGRIIYEHFVGVVIDAKDRRTVIVHVRCKGNACLNYDTGALVIGGQARSYRIEHDRPFTEVEETRAQRARGCSLESR
jgi:hypothetical protein